MKHQLRDHMEQHQLLLSKTKREYSLYRLRNLRKDFEDLRPRLLEKFDIRSILTLCAENVFFEIRSGATVPLQLEFDRRFPRALRERVAQKTLYVTCLQSTIQELYDLN